MPVLHLGEQLSLYYLDDNPTGDPAVLLIHGLGVTGESWGFQLPLLIGSGYRPIVPDLRGFGKSGFPGGDNCIEVITGDMACLITQLRVAPVYVVGISLGGAIALRLAIEHSDLVDKLVLINTFSHLRPARLTTWLFYLARGLTHQLAGHIQARQSWSPDACSPKRNIVWLRQQFLRQLSQSDPHAFRSTLHSILRFNVTDRLTEISAQLLCSLEIWIIPCRRKCSSVWRIASQTRAR